MPNPNPNPNPNTFEDAVGRSEQRVQHRGATVRPARRLLVAQQRAQRTEGRRAHARRARLARRRASEQGTHGGLVTPGEGDCRRAARLDHVPDESSK